MRPPPRLPLVSFVTLVIAAGCNASLALPGAEADAAYSGDVLLPTLDVPDGYVLTEESPDGGAASLGPSVACTPPADADGDAMTVGDAGPGDSTADGADLCASALVTGDLVFDEVMIASEAGSSDRGQWLEVENTRPCTVNLNGLHAAAPHGQSFHTLDVTGDVLVPAGGFFLIADSTDPSENHGLPGLVLAWAGAPADALHKTSDTITLSLGGVTLDTLSYPSKRRAVGTSMAFPPACGAPLRANFADWVPSNASWTPGLFGTPGAPNDDVVCATIPIATCGTTGSRKR